MKTLSNFKTNIIYTISLLYILLFTYAAVSKMLDFQNFQAQLGQSPLLSIFAEILSITVPLVEIVLSILLMIPKLRILALYFSCFLMFLFTVYIVMILNFTSFIPCSCGGVLEKLGWQEHLIFNCAFVALGLLAIGFKSGLKHTVIVTIIGFSIGIALMSGLFLLSEDIIHKENPFVRRFPQGTAARVAGVDLKNTSFYIAGATSDKVYLGNPIAPLQVFEYDRNLSNPKQHTISLDREGFPFSALQLAVVYPYFFIYDKSVPVIYKGLVSDWKATMACNKECHFNEIAFINQNEFIIRTQKQKSYDNVLAKVTIKDSFHLAYNTTVLQKQTDGIFDTDGTMHYSPQINKLIYTYHYRNQFISTDQNLNSVKRGNTIDTTTIAKLKIVKNSKSGDTKLAAPPHMVNKRTTVAANLLFVNSMLRGKFEKEEIWKGATAVDIYDITTKEYVLSFYVYNEEEFKMKDFHATKDALYIISGHFLLKYGFGERIKSKFKN
ncbi:MauE/DoxX family redox-associated membrane protein [Flavobacterium sp. 102]|uniref:MauE/DoxX family redox-associated membrane protein n=1 Tax=Flavobacterium sp. 102 TaxID=2135623 RepID=UPI000EAEB476|nr:MauE/DoxX family redox-associated membrane protein [Flavobacterium sp. 102]RKS03051.1 methylamine utilization protein MauE [Flavobacterium sp. 102]